MQLKKIEKINFENEKNKIFKLVNNIWTKKKDSDEAKNTIGRWLNGDSSGDYFYIVKNSNIIGITGFYLIDELKGFFGLRHHGTTIKGTGFEALNKLIEILYANYKIVKTISELIPKGNNELLPIFEKWGFILNKRDKYKKINEYYGYLMIKKL